MVSTPSLLPGNETPAKNSPLFLRRRLQPRLRRQDSAAVAREMYCYLQWARSVTTLTFDELIVNVMDRALSDYFGRDRAWRSLRRRILAKHDTSDWREILSGGSAEGAASGTGRA
jgi:hypothetical protein